MPYSPTLWEDGLTPINALHLNKIEDELVDLDALVGAGGNSTGEWMFSTTITEPPGSGQVRLDNVDQTLATKVWIHDLTAPGIDTGNVLAQTKTGEQIYIQDKDDASQWQLYDVLADAIDEGVYVEISVAWNKGGNALPAQRCLVSIIRAGAGGGGGGGGVEYENEWSAAVAYQSGDVVIRNGVQYLAVNPSTGSAPPAPAAPPMPVGTIPLVTSLPASPFDGQEVILVDSLTAPTYQWRFRYLAAKASNRWLFVGGPPARSDVQTNETTAATTYVDLATVGPSFVIPVTGDYLFDFSLGYWPVATATGWIALKRGAAAAVDADSATGQTNGGWPITLLRSLYAAGCAAGDTYKLVYKVNGSTGNFFKRELRVIPVAVGA